MKSTLLLNVTYEPLNAISVKRALALVLQDKATVEDASHYTMKTGTGEEIVLPYVIRLNYEVKINRKNFKAPAFQKRAMFLRDSYTCVYCGKFGNTVDHIKPRSLGGLSTYENCVTACLKCNGKKSNQTLDQLGWKQPVIKPLPHRNNYVQILNHSRNDEGMFKSWIEYLSWFDPNIKEEKLLLEGIQ